MTINPTTLETTMPLAQKNTLPLAPEHLAAPRAPAALLAAILATGTRLR